MKKSGAGARGAAIAPRTFVPVVLSDASAAQFIAAVKSLALPRVRILKGTGRAQYIMTDGSVAVTQIREDSPGGWPFVATQDGHTFPTFWKLWFVPMSDIEIEI